MREHRRGNSRLIALCMVFALLFSTCVFAGTASAAAGDGLTVRVTGSAEGETLGSAASIIAGGSLNFRYGETEDSYLFNADVSLGDAVFLSGLLNVAADKISLQIPQAGDEVYEMSMEKVAEYVQTLLSQVSELQGGQLDPSALVPQISEELVSEAFGPVLNAISGPISECIAAEAEQSVELEKLGYTVEGCTVYKFQPTAEQTEAIFTALAGALRPNEALDQLVQEFTDYIRGLDGILTTTATAAGTSEELSAQETADQIAALYAQLPDLLLENAQAAGQALEQMNATVTVAVTADGMPALIELRLSQEEQVLRAAFEFAVGESAAECYLGMQVDDEEYSARGLFGTQGTNVHAELVLTAAPYGEMAFINYDGDLSRNTLFGLPYGTLSAEAMGASFALSAGEGEEGWIDRYTIRFSGVPAADGTDPDQISIWIDVNTENTAEAPAGTPVDVSDYTVEEFEALAGQIGEALTQYLNS